MKHFCAYEWPLAQFMSLKPNSPKYLANLCEDFSLLLCCSFAGGDEDFAAASFAEFKFGAVLVVEFILMSSENIFGCRKIHKSAAEEFSEEI